MPCNQRHRLAVGYDRQIYRRGELDGASIGAQLRLEEFHQRSTFVDLAEQFPSQGDSSKLIGHLRTLSEDAFDLGQLIGQPTALQPCGAGFLRGGGGVEAQLCRLAGGRDSSRLLGDHANVLARGRLLFFGCDHLFKRVRQRGGTRRNVGDLRHALLVRRCRGGGGGDRGGRIQSCFLQFFGECSQSDAGLFGCDAPGCSGDEGIGQFGTGRA